MVDRNASVTGLWSDAATWGGSAPPTGAQTWNIATGVTVTLDADPGALTGAGTLTGAARLIIACIMTGSLGPITVANGAQIYSSRSVSNYLRVAGLVTLNGPHGLDFGTSTDQCSDPAIGHGFETVCTSDSQASRGISCMAEGAIDAYGAALDNESTLAQQETVSTTNTHVVLTDDMALRPGTMADVQKGLADLIVIGQNPIIGVGYGAQKYQIDVHRVAGYNAGTKTVDLEDTGAGDSTWPRGGTATGLYKDIDTTREIGCDVRRLGANVVFCGTAYNLRPQRGLDFSASFYGATLKNVLFLWFNTSSSHGAIYHGGATLNVESCHFAANYNGLAFCISSVNSGSGNYVGNAYGWNTCTTCVHSGSGSFMGNSAGWLACVSCINSGSCSFFGNSSSWSGCTFCINSGPGMFIGSANGWYACISCVNSGSGDFVGHSYGWTTCTYCINSGSGSFIRNSSGWYTCNSCFNAGSGTFSGNNYNFRRDRFGKIFGIPLDFGIENGEYTYSTLPWNNYTESIDHDNTPGAYKAWGKACVIASQIGVYPVGKTWSYQIAMEIVSPQVPSFIQRSYVIRPGETLTLNVWMKKDANGMTVIPACMIVDPRYDPMYSALWSPLASYVMSEDLLWQTATLTYKNIKPVPMEVYIRAIATNSTSSFYFYYEVMPSGGGAPIIGSSIVRGCEA